jgi:hypothetical protein
VSSPVASEEKTASRWARALPAIVVAAGFVLTVAASHAVGPAFDEEPRVIAVRRATDLFRLVASGGPRAFFDDAARPVYRELAAFGVAPGLLSGWLGEVLSRIHVIDRLVGARLGWLAFTGLAPGALFLIVRKHRGPRVGALAAALLLAVPRWIHAAALGREPAVVASIWLVLLALYVEGLPAPRPRGAPPRRSRRWPFVLFGAFLGFGMAVDFAALWVVPLVLVHFALVQGRRARRAVARGRLPVPAGFLPALLLAPVALVVAAPPLWAGGADAAAWLLSPLEPVVEPALYRGPIVSAQDVPPGFAAHWLVATTPAWLVLLAVAGAVVLFLDARDVRRRLAPRDPTRLGVLVALVVGSVLLGAFFTPGVFVRFPPRAEAALPFLVALAAIALDRLTTKVVGSELAVRIESPLAVIAVAITAANLPTGGASFSTLVGGPGGAQKAHVWSVGDGSEVASLARNLDALATERLPLSAPDVPRSYWALLNQTKRLRTRIDLGPDAALSITRGEHAKHPLATVTRDKAVLWSLSRD